MGKAGLAAEGEPQESAEPVALLDREEEEAGPALSEQAAWAAEGAEDALGKKEYAM